MTAFTPPQRLWTLGFPNRRKHTEAAGVLTHRSDRRDQSGGYGEASRRLGPMLVRRQLLTAYSPSSDLSSRTIGSTPRPR